MGGHLGHAGGHFVGRQVMLVVVQPEVPRGQAGVVHLVVAVGVEADGIGVHRPVSDLAQHAADGGAVGAARQEGADRTAAEALRLARDGALQQAAKLVFQGIEIWLLDGAEHGLPVGLDHRALRIRHEPVPGQQAAHARVDGVGCRNDVVEEVGEDRLRVDGRPVGQGVGAVGHTQPAAAAGVAPAVNGHAVVEQE